jgi:hypothetical protein
MKNDNFFVSKFKDNFNSNMKNDILFVTAFKDIGREKWGENQYKRTNEDYFRFFYNLASNIEYKLLVYVDDDIKEQLFSKYTFRDNIEFYNQTHANIFMDRYLEKEQAILDSDEFKKKIPLERLNNNPETWSAMYNMITHSKVNYVLDAKRKYPNYKFYSWIDFGFVREIEYVPKNLKLEKIPEKIVIVSFYIPEKFDEVKVLQIGDFFKTGGFIIPNNLVEIYHDKYEKKIIQWQNNNISDDDQSLALQLYFDDPEIFHIIIDDIWFSLYKYFT